jgi:hypothetical protein
MMAAAPGGGAAAGNADAVLAEVKEQLKAVFAGLQTGSGEAARHAASLVQVWAARIHSRTPDGELRSLAQRAVRRHGRAAFLDTPPNHAEMEANMRSLGLTTADIARLDLHAPVEPQAKAAALDRLLAGGFQPIVDRTVQMMLDAANQLDARAGLAPVAARQQGCDACIAADMAKSEMEIACAFAAIFPVMAEICAMFAGIYIMAQSICWICRLFWG